MITAIVNFPAAEGATSESMAKAFSETAPLYEGLPGLIRKYYLYDPESGTVGRRLSLGKQGARRGGLQRRVARPADGKVWCGPRGPVLRVAGDRRQHRLGPGGRVTTRTGQAPMTHTTLITGAAKGIGADLAGRLVARGDTVIGLDLLDDHAVDATGLPSGEGRPDGSGGGRRDRGRDREPNTTSRVWSTTRA